MMDFDAFQEACERTRNRELTGHMAILHGMAGAVGETGELANVLLEPFPSIRAVRDEAGDVLFYCAHLATDLGLFFSRLATADEANLHRYRSLGGNDLAVGLGRSVMRLCERVKKKVFHAVDRDIAGALAEHVARVLTLCEDRGLSFREVAEFNISKLQRRFPNGWVAGGGVR